MVNLENYLYDGAGWQARAVMCYLQSMVEVILDKTYTGEAWMPYDGKLFINQYHYGREKGYVFSVRYKNHQANYAVYEHCVADCICVVKGNALTEHSDGWDGKEWSKYDHDKEFSYGETTKCGEWIEADMRKEIDKWIAEENKNSEYEKEKERLLDIIRDGVEKNNGYLFDDEVKTFNPIYCGSKQEERLLEVYTEDGEEGEKPYVVVVTSFIDGGTESTEHTNCEEFSNDEIKEIIKLLGLEC
jgi:hypothetical protein